MKKLLLGLFVFSLLAIGTQVYAAEEGCPVGQNYSLTTGLQCGCSHDEVYSSTTGQACPAPTSSITIISPNGGETYKAGDKMTIRWKTMNAYNPNTLVAVIDDRIPDWQTLSLFGSSPALNYAKYISASGNSNGTEYTYEYTFTVPATFNNSLPSQYQNIYGGNHYKILVNIVLPGQVILEDYSDKSFTINSLATTHTTDLTPRISYWYGKVNQHVDVASGAWQTDPDGTSGADLDKLAYCKKWYPNTTSVAEYKNEVINSWHDRGNLNNYTSTKMFYACVAGTITPSTTVLSPNGRETYNYNGQIPIKWTSAGKDRIAIYLRFSSGEWCFIKDVPSSNTNYTFTPYGHDCGPGRGVISSGQYKVTLILYENGEMTPEPGTAFAGDYNDGDSYGNSIDSSDNYFTINSSTDNGCLSGEGYSSTTGQRCPENNKPVIYGVSGPQSLIVGQTGTWKVVASSSTGANLSYSVVWGDEGYQLYAMSSVQPVTNTQQSATFTHSYSQAGTYNPTFTVTSENTIRCITTPCPSNGGSTTTSLSVKVGSSIYPAGCNSTEGYSYTTGLACDGSQGNGIDGCLPGQNYSSTTGQQCIIDDVYSTNTKASVVAQCLKNKGATLYGTSWCSHCQSQKALFGNYADIIPYVECSTLSGTGQIDICSQANITSYPTWKFNDGSKLEGEQSLLTLTNKTNCGGLSPSTSIRRTLRRGIKGDDVKILQLFLNLAADGSFGPQTQAKVMEWQAVNGLKVDGAFGIQSATKAGLAE